jgi:hypothetical protein
VTEPPGPVPDGIEPIVAYRAWCVESEEVGGLLGSVAKKASPWVPRRWTQARCFRTEGIHQAPMEGCTCGLYAMTDLQEVTDELGAILWASPSKAPEGLWPLMLGKVQLAGKVIEHDRGYRAQSARVLAFLPAPGQEAMAERLSAVYAVPVSTELLDAWDDLHERYGRRRRRLGGFGIPAIPGRIARPQAPERGFRRWIRLAERPVGLAVAIGLLAASAQWPPALLWSGFLAVRLLASSEAMPWRGRRV